MRERASERLDCKVELRPIGQEELGVSLSRALLCAKNHNCYLNVVSLIRNIWIIFGIILDWLEEVNPVN
jgi:hypothetical protein